MSREPDIVERLRNPSGDIFPMCREAADEIERLRAALQEIAAEPATLEAKIEIARDALEPKPSGAPLVPKSCIK